MTEIQHTLTVRRNKQLIKINCPPFASIDQLNTWLVLYREANPTDTIVSKSWSANATI